MEKQIMDILNVGIGLLQAGKEGLERAKTELEKSYTELSAKGAQDSSEGAVQIRQSLDKIIGDIKEFTSVAGKNYEDTRSKIIDNYDKIHDLESSIKSEKRAIERANVIQLSIFDQLEKRRQFEVLRMETRLNKRQKMKQLFQSLGIETDLTFKVLFNQKTSQKVLLHYLDLLETQRPALLDYKAENPRDILASLIINNPSMKKNRILCLYGLKIALDTITLRELRVMFSKSNSRSWYRLMSEAKNVKLPVTISPFKIIRDDLTKFEPLRLVDFQDRMINNDK
jgi:hypothetical protein